MVDVGDYCRALREHGIEPLPYLQQWRMSSDSAWADVVTRWASAIGDRAALLEVGNEPAPIEWDFYFRYLRIAAPIVRAAGRRLVLAAPAYGVALDYWAAVPDDVWGLVDGVAMHPYAPTPARVLERLRGWRALVPADLPVYVTEFGWATGGIGSWTVVDEATQARYLRETVLELDAAARELKLLRAVWYQASDFESDWHPGRWDHFCGLRRLDGTHKPAWRAMREVLTSLE